MYNSYTPRPRLTSPCLRSLRFLTACQIFGTAEGVKYDRQRRQVHPADLERCACVVDEPVQPALFAGLRVSLSRRTVRPPRRAEGRRQCGRSEEHTSELQSQSNLLCRL